MVDMYDDYLGISTQVGLQQWTYPGNAGQWNDTGILQIINTTQMKYVDGKGDELDVGDEIMYRSSKVVISALEGGYIYWNGNNLYQNNGSYLITKVKKNMNLIQKMAVALKGEPEKSFIKAGIMNPDESLTGEGTAVFLSWMLKQNGDAFKKDVVDPILAEEKDSK